jgi:dienelactone hydrolase
MRPLESALVSLVAIAAFLLMTDRAQKFRTPLTLLGVLVCAIHLVLEGGHWQMFPVYLALVLVVAWQFVPALGRAIHRQAPKIIMMSLVVVLCVASIGFSLVAPMFSLPKPTGPYQVGTRTIYMVDTSRNEDAISDPGRKRELAIQVWYPAEPSTNHLAAYRERAETKLNRSYQSVIWTNSRTDAPLAKQNGPFPVLLFGHGLGGSRTQATFLTEELASHGYVVVAVDHPFTAKRVAIPGRGVVLVSKAFDYRVYTPALMSGEAMIEQWNKELAKWTADDIFVLNELHAATLDPKSPWYQGLNTDLVGAFGHSFGGAASLQLCSLDPRVKSAINMDGWSFAGITYRTSDRPMMFMYEDGLEPTPEQLRSPDRAIRVEAELDTADTELIDTNLKQFGGYKLYIAGAQHMDFTDQSLYSPWHRLTETGPIPPARMHEILREYVLTFFDNTIYGKDSPLLESGNTSPFREVRFEHWTPESRHLVPTAASVAAGHSGH